MLLVRGERLQQALFTVEGEGVKLIRTETSANGHWAFLWLDTRSAAAQTLMIGAANKEGSARQGFVLAERSRDPNAHRGFSSADVLYLVMTDVSRMETRLTIRPVTIGLRRVGGTAATWQE